MVVRHTLAAGQEPFSQQIDKIIKSHSLRGSESLRKLLQYLATQALNHPDAPLKEYQIATEVYGRPSDFDPQTDSTVRVQAGRLRLKLGEYYAAEGAADPLVVKIPKGSYHLTFEARSLQPKAIGSGGGPLHSVPPGEARGTAVVEVIPARWRVSVVVLLVALMASLITLGSVLWNRRVPSSTSGSSALASPGVPRAAGPLADFWRPFTSGTDAPWVIFSNAAFVGRPETGMRYYNSRQDSKVAVYDHYTGVGEVLAIHALDDAFGALGRTILVKRGSLFTLDDVKDNNLIFVGSPSENLSLLDIPNMEEFVFQRVASGKRQGDLSIVNKHPKPGEANAYLASPSDAPLTEDYAVIGLVPGIGSGRYVMILAGTTTFGTQGAVEFVCRQDSVEKLLHEIPDFAGLTKPFEALVRVKIARGVPVESELVAVRGR
jgi:hypothetical protein